MDRPAGVIILSFLYTVTALLVFAAALLFAIDSKFTGNMPPEMQPILGSFGVPGGIVLVFTGIALIALAVGLFQLREWARIVAMALAVAALIVALLSFVMPVEISGATLAIRVAVCGLTLWYLNQATVKGRFGRR